MNNFHQSVLVNEIIGFLKVVEGKKYIDATVGGGGLTKELIENGANVLGIDCDPDAIGFVNKRQDIEHKNLVLVEGNFEKIDEIANKHQFMDVDGIIFDLGVSSYQLDVAERGFSFYKDAQLDMRMSPKLAVTAKDLIGGLGRKELYELFIKYSQEKLAKPIANAIVSERRLKPISTTKQLADLITKVYGRRAKKKIHPATKVFQALRIAVNDEINNLIVGLTKARRLIKSEGRLILISFHEGEDRIVKNFFKKQALLKKVKIITKKPIVPSRGEVLANVRSRSAKLRCVEII